MGDREVWERLGQKVGHKRRTITFEFPFISALDNYQK